MCLRVSLTHYKLMSTPAFLAAAVVLGLAGAFALIKHRSKKTIKTSNKVAPLDEEEQAEIAASVARPRRNLSRSSTFSSNSGSSLAALAEPC